MKKAMVQISYADIEAAFNLPPGSIADVRSAQTYRESLEANNAFTGRKDSLPPGFNPAGGPIFKLYTVGPEIEEGSRIPLLPLSEVQNGND